LEARLGVVTPWLILPSISKCPDPRKRRSSSVLGMDLGKRMQKVVELKLLIGSQRPEQIFALLASPWL
jgi:hypothetical protein